MPVTLELREAGKPECALRGMLRALRGAFPASLWPDTGHYSTAIVTVGCRVGG